MVESAGGGAAGTGSRFRHGPLRYLPAPIREPRSPLTAVLTAWPTAFLPSILLAGFAATLAPDLAQPKFPATGPLLLFLLVIFSPFLETLIMAAALEVLERLFPPTFAVLASSLGWGVAHSLAAPAWGLVIWWPFLIFSTLYLVWRPRGRPRALAIVFATHALQNLPVALLHLAHG